MAKTRSYAFDLDFLTTLSIARSRRVQYLLAALCGAIVALLVLVTDFAPPLFAAPLGMAMAIIGYAPQPILMRKRLTSPDYRNAFRSRIVEVSEGIFNVAVDDGTRSEIPLTSFVQAVFGRGIYYLVLSPDSHFGIPKDAFLSEGDHEDFLAQVRTAIPDRRGF